MFQHRRRGSGDHLGGEHAEKGGPLDLASVCPATVVMQQDWQPESEHGAMYNLVGDGYTVDTEKKTVTGPLVVNGTDTGVKIEVRSGGPAVNFQPVPRSCTSTPTSSSAPSTPTRRSSRTPTSPPSR
jgi:hypothetical protein